MRIGLAADGKYKVLHEGGWTSLLGMDTDRKILRYLSSEGEELEFLYE